MKYCNSVRENAHQILTVAEKIIVNHSAVEELKKEILRDAIIK
jgi:hypothetical protein